MDQPIFFPFPANQYSVCWGVCHTPQCPSPSVSRLQPGHVWIVGLWCEQCWTDWASPRPFAVVPPEFELRRTELRRSILVTQIALRRGIALDCFFICFYQYPPPHPVGEPWPIGAMATWVAKGRDVPP